jgi:GTP-binding protein
VKPVIALVGRPNVGKSTLFNRLTKSRDAIVADFAGLTRDRHYGDGQLDKHEFIVIDTGGFEPDASTGIVQKMAQQTTQAIAEADAVLFVVDARAGISAQDHDIAGYLRIANKKVILTANKAEGMKVGPQLNEFYELGLGEPCAVSAAHGQGIRELVYLALQDESFQAETDTDTENPEGQNAGPAAEDHSFADRPIKLAVAGRPNVGKSTLINTWLGEERLVAFDMPGTTRDAITVSFERKGQQFELIDTAGLRRKGKVFESIEKFSVIKTLQAIADAHVVVLLLDATQGVTDQDAHIAGYILESGRAVVIAINKWDLVDGYQRQMIQQSIEQRLAFLRYATIQHISAKLRQGLDPLWKHILSAWSSAICKLSTPQLTRVLQKAVEFQQPPRAGRFRPKLRYAHQGGHNPPVVVIHGNSVKHLSDAYKRYIEGRIRTHFKLQGTPLRLELKDSKNPFKENN